MLALLAPAAKPRAKRKSERRQGGELSVMPYPSSAKIRRKIDESRFIKVKHRQKGRGKADMGRQSGRLWAFRGFPDWL